MKTDATHKVTRLEIIDDGGRGYVNMRAGGIEMSLLDDDRTMKIFTKGRSNASDERMFTESEVREIARKMNRILAFGRTESSNKAVASMLALHGIVLDPA